MKNHAELFWIALIFSGMAGWIWANGNFWLGMCSFMFGLNLLSIKWIIITLESIEKEVLNDE